jgi:hypothetical protein
MPNDRVPDAHRAARSDPPQRALRGPQASAGRRRSIARRALAALGGVLLALASGEGLQRAVWGWPNYSESLRFDGTLGTRLPANSEVTSRDDRGPFPIRTNSEGFRSRPMPRAGARDPSRRRLLVVGDSFVHGWAIRSEERFPEQALLQSGLEADLDVLCCDDWGTLQEWLALRRYGPHLDPDWVVLALFPENDLFNSHLPLAGMSNISASDAIRPYWNGRVDSDGWPGVTAIHPRRAWLRRQSALFARLEHAGVRTGRWAYLSPEALSMRNGPRQLHFEILEPQLEPGLWEPAWLNLEALVLGFAASVRRLGARPLILIVPAVRQVQVCALMEERDVQRQLDNALSGAASPRSQADFDLPERRLAARFEQAGVDCAVALGAIRRVAAESPAGAYLRDGHLNDRGQIALGGVLAQWLRLVADAPAPPPEGLRLGDLGQGPVDILGRGDNARSWLDFTLDLPLKYMTHGIEWRREPGWLGESERLAEVIDVPVRAVLQVQPGALIVHGRAVGRKGFPLTIETSVYGLTMGKMVLSGPGDFVVEARNPVQSMISEAPPGRLPYVPVAVKFSTLPGQALPHIGLRQLGFLPASVPSPLEAPSDK